MLSADAFGLDWSQILSFRKELNTVPVTCIQKPLKGSNKDGLLQQVVFK